MIVKKEGYEKVGRYKKVPFVGWYLFGLIPLYKVYGKEEYIRL